MKRMSIKNNAQKLFTNKVCKIRSSKQRKALNQVKNDMINYHNKNMRFDNRETMVS